MSVRKLVITAQQAIALGERIKRLRKITRLSRRSFASKHDISYGTLQNCEAGRYLGITPKTISKFVFAFQKENINCNSEWLIHGTGKPPEHKFENSLPLAEIEKIHPMKIDETSVTAVEKLRLTIENEKKHKRVENFFSNAINGRYREIIHSIQEYGITEYLLEGENIKKYNSDHNTPLHLAALNGHTDILKYLIKKGAKINAKNRKMQTPLHLAVFNAYKPIVAYILSQGIDINSTDDEGDTALAWAAYRGHSEIVKTLLEAGAILSTKNKSGNTPLHWACEKGFTDIAKLLIDFNANLNEKNSNGETPEVLAIKNGRVDTVKFLLKHTNYL